MEGKINRCRFYLHLQDFKNKICIIFVPSVQFLFSCDSRPRNFLRWTLWLFASFLPPKFLRFLWVSPLLIQSSKSSCGCFKLSRVKESMWWVFFPSFSLFFYSPQEFTCQRLLKSAVTQRAMWVTLPQNHWIRNSSSTLCGPFEGKCYLFILSLSSSPSPKSWGKTPGV